MGVWLRAYEYDGVGRLVTVLSSEDPAGNVTTAPVTRIEQYIHDGEQRIAEIVGDSANGLTPRTDREYVWDPRSIDRLVCQLDALRAPWLVLTDRNNTPTALIDGKTGLIHQQYATDPFGEVLAADELRAGCPLVPTLKVGYQGLHSELADGMLGKSPLKPGAATLTHNRARAYVPALGRFLQADPNAAGIALPKSGSLLGKFGAVPAALGVNLSPLQQYADGGNLYAAVGGNPVQNSDPRGLFGYIDALSTGLEMADMAADMMEQGRQGLLAGLGLQSMIDSYAVMQDVNADWASDWGISDEGSSYSQSFDLGIGVWADDSCECGDGASDDGGDGPAMASGIRLGAKQNRATYDMRRSQWTAVRRSLLRAEAKSKKGGWTPAERKRMTDGFVPEGWNIHHRRPLASGGSNAVGNLHFIPTSTHRSQSKQLHCPPYPLPSDSRPVRNPSDLKPAIPRKRMR